MTTLPPPYQRTVCPHCGNSTGVTFGSVAVYGAPPQIYLGCSRCNYVWSGLADDDWSLDVEGITAPRDSRVIIH